MGIIDIWAGIKGEWPGRKYTALWNMADRFKSLRGIRTSLPVVYTRTHPTTRSRQRLHMGWRFAASRRFSTGATREKPSWLAVLAPAHHPTLEDSRWHINHNKISPHTYINIYSDHCEVHDSTHSELHFRLEKAYSGDQAR